MESNPGIHVNTCPDVVESKVSVQTRSGKEFNFVMKYDFTKLKYRLNTPPYFIDEIKEWVVELEIDENGNYIEDEQDFRLPNVEDKNKDKF